MKPILRVGGRWAVSWMSVGLVCGLVLMLGKIGIAEPGPKGLMSTYGMWVPVLAVTGAAFGFGLGVVYAPVMVLARPLREKAGTTTWAARNLPRLICGCVAGAVIGAWSGPEGAAMFGILGLVSASLSRFDRLRP
jgi:hypothetical protein